MNKYLYLPLCLLLASCGGSSSTKEAKKENPKIQGYSYTDMFSKNELKSKNTNIINKNKISKGTLEFPKNITLSSQEEIKSYLEKTYNLQLEDAPLEIKKSLNFTSYKFIQKNPKAKKCGSSINITIDKTNKVFKTYLHKIDNFDTCKTAVNYVETPRKYEMTKPPALNLGNIEKTTIKIFNPDPLSTSKGQLKIPEDFSTLEISDTLYFTKEVDALKKDGKLYFSNNKVQSVDLIKRQNNPKEEVQEQPNQQGIYKLDSFDYTFKDKRFYDQMAFYHIDNSIKYIESLGFNFLKKPVYYDTQLEGKDNSTYYPDMNIITFGMGQTPDTLDADIILHELAHAISYSIISDYADGDTPAMGEGFSDYWAGQYSMYLQKNDKEKYKINEIFTFDGYYNKKTRKLNNLDAKYNIYQEYRAHVSVNGHNGDELWSTPLFSTLKESIKLYGDIAYDEVNKILIESFYGLGYGLKMFQMADSIIQTAKIMYPNKKYHEMFFKNFQHHNIYQNKLKYLIDKPFVDDKKIINLKLQNIYFEDIYDIKTDVSSNNLVFDKSQLNIAKIEVGKIENQNLKFNINNNLKCSDDILLNIKTNYNLSKQIEQHKTESIKLTYGIPYFKNMMPFIQKDITLDSQSFVINQKESEIIDDNFTFILDLSSEDLTKISVILKTPWGEEVNLLQNIDFSKNNIKRAFILKNENIFKEFKGKDKKGLWFLKINNYSKDNKIILNKYGLTKVTSYSCK